MSQKLRTSEWKSIDGYEVSSDGRIRRNNHEIKGTKNRKGYVRVYIKGNKVFLHRIIARVFLGEPKEGQQVNHKNGIKCDNRVENLEWCSPSYNLKHSYSFLGRKASLKGKKRERYVVEKIIKKLKGQKRTKEQNKRNSESHKGKGLLSENPNAKKIVCIETGKKYGSIKEAGIDNKINPYSIGQSIKNNKKIKNLTFKKEN